MSKTDYSIVNMRFVPTSGKQAERHPDRIGTVYGEFHALDDKGKPKPEPLTFSSKVITREEALSDVFAIDVDAGTLTVPAGERGRKAAPGMSADGVAALLASLRTDSASA